MSNPQTLAAHKLNLLRQNLLDLSLRNPLLNYQPRVRSVPLHNPATATLLTQLQSRRLRLHSTAQMPQRPQLLTELSPEHLQQRAQQLHRQSQAIRQETGINPLHLTLESLQWQPEAGSAFVQAPLLLLPVTLHRQPTAKTVRYELSSELEALILNPALQEKLANTFQIRLPDFNAEQSFSAWHTALSTALHAFPHWQINAVAWLDLFSFNRWQMYHDLSDAHWTSAHYSRLLPLFNPQSAPPNAAPAPPSVSDLPLIFAADSSQQAILQEVLHGEQSLVVEGPPGTGKSQTIANLIAAALAQEKTVLFVAEKPAALAVVQQRLQQAGLAAFCFALHQPDTTKKQVYQAITQRLQQTAADFPDPAALPDIGTVSKQLQDQARLLAYPIGPQQQPCYEVLWQLEQLRQQLPGAPIALNLTAQEDSTALKTQLDALVAHLQAVPPDWLAAWEGFTPHAMLSDAAAARVVVTHQVRALLQTLQPLADHLEQLHKQAAWPWPLQLDQLPSLEADGITLLANPPAALTAEVAQLLTEATAVQALAQYANALQQTQQQYQAATALLGEPPAAVDSLIAACEALQAVGWARLSLWQLHSYQQLLTHYQTSLTTYQEALTEEGWQQWQLLQLLQQPPPALAIGHHPAHLQADVLTCLHAARQRYHHSISALLPHWLSQWWPRQSATASPESAQLGPLFQAAATDWAALQAVIEWSQQLQALVGAERAAYWLGQADPVAAAWADLALTAGHWWPLLQIAQQLELLPAQPNHHALLQLASTWQQRQRLLAASLPVLTPLSALQQYPILTLHTALQQQRHAQTHRQQLQQTAPTALAYLPITLQQDAAQLQQLAQWLQALQACLTPKLQAWLFADLPRRAPLLYQLHHLHSRYHQQSNSSASALAAWGELVWARWLPTDQPLSVVLARLQQRLDGLALYWADFWAGSQLQQRLQATALQPLVQAIQQHGFSEFAVNAHWRYALLHNILQQYVQQHPVLTTLTTADYQQLTQQFSRHAAALPQYHRARLIQTLLRRTIPQGNGSGRVADYTELFLLAHEANKKQRHLPLRQLMRRAGRALQALQPCFLMNPLNIAHHLPPAELEFDLVIIDEASQMRPQNALGALLRAHQAVVVGDSRQLPPTHFFQRLTDPNAPRQVEPAILDLCRQAYPHRQLRWHYRSAHQGLIAFANAQFYDNSLYLIPASFAQHPNYGIQRHYLAEARYQHGKNPQEAAAIVAAIQQHCREHSERSLGVATFNLAQQGLITDLLEQASASDQTLAAWLQSQTALAEPFFIKPLEHVQGDERDVMLLSTTYGPNPQGQFYQRFGPLATEQGWRRLNVVITRAREQLQVFTALTAEMIQLHPNSRRGVQALKAWLQSLESPPVISPLSAMPSDIAFIKAIQPLLEAAGYQVALNIGVGPFRVPLAICDPNNPTRYLVGIVYESSGDPNHSDLYEREYRRWQLLEAKGWRLLRLHSWGWFKGDAAQNKAWLEAEIKSLMIE